MSQPKGAGRLVGIDYLRAFFSICVVAVHLGYVYPSSIFDKSAFREHTFTWSDFVNFYVLCLAVPVFVLISTYLYALKPTDSRGLQRRLWRIIRLLLFWSNLFEVFYYTGYGFLKVIPQDAHELAIYFFTAGNTVYYFFLSLAIATLATHYAVQQSTFRVWLLLAASTLLVGVLPLLHQATGSKIFGLHANPFNFLPLAFVGVLMARVMNAGNIRLLDRLGYAALALGVITALLDWTIYIDECFFGVNRFALPAYTRPSLIFLAAAVVIFAIRWQPRGNAVVRFMSRYSLGVYCLHPFFVPVKYKLVEKLQLSGAAEVLLPLTVVVGLSYLGAIAMSWFVKDELIR